MTVNNTKTAKEWIKSWGDQMRPGILGSAIDASYRCSAISETQGAKEEMLDHLEALGILKLHYFQLYGKAYLV